MTQDKKTGKPLLKLGILVLFIAAAVAVVRFTPAGDHLSARNLSVWLESAGWLAPVFYVLAYAAGSLVLVPGTMLTAVGAILFGPWLGFVLVWLGAMIGSTLCFLAARHLGRDFIAQRLGGKVRRLDAAVEKNGFAAVLYLRLVYFPFNVMNFGMGLTRVRFKDYVAGTALGILVGTFLFTFFIGSIKQAWVESGWAGLVQWKSFLAAGLFVGSFFIPLLVKRLKRFQGVQSRVADEEEERP